VELRNITFQSKYFDWLLQQKICKVKLPRDNIRTFNRYIISVVSSHKQLKITTSTNYDWPPITTTADTTSEDSATDSESDAESEDSDKSNDDEKYDSDESENNDS